MCHCSLRNVGGRVAQSGVGWGPCTAPPMIRMMNANSRRWKTAARTFSCAVAVVWAPVTEVRLIFAVTWPQKEPGVGFAGACTKLQIGNVVHARQGEAQGEYP